MQALAVFSAATMLMLGGVALDKIRVMSMDPLYPWSIATAFMLLFALLNSISSLQSNDFARYWGASMYSYLGLALACGLMAWLTSGIPVGKAGSYKFIYLVVSVGFLVFLSLINMVKKIVNFAEKEEWNQPRKRS